MTSLAVGRIQVESDGEGPAILFVHGLGGTSNSFQPLLGALGGFRCVRPDLPGSGRSPAPPEKLTIEGFARTVADVARAAGAAPAHLVGHSMGTLVCQHLAAALPDQVRSLTLFGPILEPPDAARERIRGRAAIAREQGMVPVADAVADAGLASSTKASNPIAAAFVRESHMRQDAESFARTCVALAEAKAADLRLVRCPTLVVTGEEDAVGPPSMAQMIVDRIKGAKLKLLDRCGHWTPIERPQDCARLLSDFLRSQPR
ncbi:MAG: alpha/beta hydrolase [Geminicoccaceae bacterium]